MNGTVRTILPRLAGAFAVAFGAMTVFSGGMTLSGALDRGAVVPFVLWFNTLAGPVYVLAGIGIWKTRAWAFPLSLAILAATLVVFAGFGWHVAGGGAYETRTVFAMTFRAGVWGLLAFVARQAASGR